MNRQSSVKLTRIVTLCFVTLLFAIGASAQIRIGNIEIKTPTTSSNGNQIPNPNGNKTPTSTSNAEAITSGLQHSLRMQTCK